jgi:hypothetical protein
LERIVGNGERLVSIHRMHLKSRHTGLESEGPLVCSSVSRTINPFSTFRADAESPRMTHDDGFGRLRIEKVGWPRRKLVMRETGTELGDSLRERIDEWGYPPEDSLGFCPTFTNRGIYFAWCEP